jgi:aspartyl-tRNA(Asn)/glutamyl-tRNA(Gln) amidotransferase subunit C
MAAAARPPYIPPTMAEHHAITTDDVQKVAKLARLEFSAEQLPGFTVKLGAILEYIDQLAKVDTGNVEPMAHSTGLVNVLREDVVEASLTVEQVLSNAPDSDPPFFKVPKVIGGEEDSAG